MPNFTRLEVGKFYVTRDGSAIYHVNLLQASAVNADRNSFKAFLVLNLIPHFASSNYSVITRWADGKSNRNYEGPKDLIGVVPDPRIESTSVRPGRASTQSAQVTPATASREEFFIVFSPTGPTPPRMRHLTFELADAEAQRMARAHPNQQFFVMKPLIKHQAVSTIASERYD